MLVNTTRKDYEDQIGIDQPLSLDPKNSVFVMPTSGKPSASGRAFQASLRNATCTVVAQQKLFWTGVVWDNIASYTSSLPFVERKGDGNQNGTIAGTVGAMAR